MTPTSTAYQTFALAGKEDLTSGVSAVTINGTALPKDDDGKVDIPLAAQGSTGVVNLDYQYGFFRTVGGGTYISSAAYTNSRTNATAKYRPVTFDNIDGLVMQTLAECKDASLWTEDKQAAARALLGISIWDGGVSE